MLPLQTKKAEDKLRLILFELDCCFMLEEGLILPEQ